MMTAAEIELPELWLGTYVTPEGRNLARVGLGLTAYLDAPELWARGGALRVLETFLRRIPRRELLNVATSLTPTWRAIGASGLDEVLETFRYTGLTRGVRHLFWVRLANDTGAPSLGFSYTEVDPQRSERTGVLEITLPEPWRSDELHSLAMEVLSTGPVCSLIAGKVFRYDRHEQARAFHQIYRWASRYIAIDVQLADEMAWLAPHSLPGSSWLTYVGERLARTREIDLGSLRAREWPHDVRATPVADGLLLQAGAEPVQGDLNRLRFPHAYSEVARLLGPYFADPPPELWGSFHLQKHTSLWFRRLIEPTPWIERRIDLDV